MSSNGVVARRTTTTVGGQFERGHVRVTRRRFLKAVGIGGGFVAAGGLSAFTWRATSQGVFEAGQGEAYAAWHLWDQGSTPLILVRSAILAANPHNTQPWRFVVSSSAIDVYVDPNRNTAAMDPYRREQHIGLGCSLENLVIASQAKGLAPTVSVLPDPTDPNLIAHVELGQGTPANQDLYRTIPKRHTDRSAFDTTRSVSEVTLGALDQSVADIGDAGVVWISSDAPKSQIGQLIVEGAQAFAADRDQSTHSHRWWRDSWGDIQRYKDGMTIDTSGASPLVIAIGKILPPLSREQNDQSWIQLTRDQYVKTASAFGIVVVRDATNKRQRINGGRLYQRLHLSAVERGLAMQPLNTLTERIDREKVLGIAPRFTDAVATLIQQPDWHPLMSFRIGYSTVSPPPSPRRPANQVMAP